MQQLHVCQMHALSFRHLPRVQHAIAGTHHPLARCTAALHPPHPPPLQFVPAGQGGWGTAFTTSSYKRAAMYRSHAEVQLRPRRRCAFASSGCVKRLLAWFTSFRTFCTLELGPPALRLQHRSGLFEDAFIINTQYNNTRLTLAQCLSVAGVHRWSAF